MDLRLITANYFSRYRAKLTKERLDCEHNCGKQPLQENYPNEKRLRKMVAASSSALKAGGGQRDGNYPPGSTRGCSEGAQDRDARVLVSLQHHSSPWFHPAPSHPGAEQPGRTGPHQEALMSAINGQGLLIAFGGREERALLGSPFGNAQQPGLAGLGER